MSFQNQSVQYVLSKHQEAHSICFRSSMVSIEVGWTVAAWVNPAVEPFWATIVAKYDQLNWEA